MRLLPLALLALAAAASSGCRKSMAPICRQICDCSPCTDTDFDACVTKGDDAQQAAEKSGCEDTFDTLVGCLEDNLSCRKDGLGPGTDQCVRADRALVVCNGTVNPFASACEEAPVKTQACTGLPQTPFPAGSLCASFQLCAATCSLSQTCEELTSNGSAAILADCVNTCQGKIEPPPDHSPP